MVADRLQSPKSALWAMMAAFVLIQGSLQNIKNTASPSRSVKTSLQDRLIQKRKLESGLRETARGNRKVELLKAYALSFLGTPYKFGGANRLTGLDCSEFVQELLRSVGMDPPGDQTAQALFDHFSQKGDWGKTQAGALAFFGKDAKSITHVAMLLDQYRIIEAGGGDSTTSSLQDAQQKGAMVRIRLLKFRKDLVAVIRPQYIHIGQL